MTVAFASIFVSAASAETIEVSDNHGGRVVEYDARWAARGAWRRCQDRRTLPVACTWLLGHIPRDKICVTPNRFVRIPSGQSAERYATLEAPTRPISRLGSMPTAALKKDFIWLRAPDIFPLFQEVLIAFGPKPTLFGLLQARAHPRRASLHRMRRHDRGRYAEVTEYCVPPSLPVAQRPARATNYRFVVAVG